MGSTTIYLDAWSRLMVSYRLRTGDLVLCPENHEDDLDSVVCNSSLVANISIVIAERIEKYCCDHPNTKFVEVKVPLTRYELIAWADFVHGFTTNSCNRALIVASACCKLDIDYATFSQLVDERMKYGLGIAALYGPLGDKPFVKTLASTDSYLSLQRRYPPTDLRLVMAGCSYMRLSEFISMSLVRESLMYAIMNDRRVGSFNGNFDPRDYFRVRAAVSGAELSKLVKMDLRFLNWYELDGVDLADTKRVQIIARMSQWETLPSILPMVDHRPVARDTVISAIYWERATRDGSSIRNTRARI